MGRSEPARVRGFRWCDDKATDDARGREDDDDDDDERQRRETKTREARTRGEDERRERRERETFGLLSGNQNLIY